MNSYKNLKTQIAATQQKMVGVDKSELKNALKEVKCLSTGFGLTTRMINGLLAKGWNKK